MFAHLVEVAIASAALLTALGVIYHKALRPMVLAARRLADMAEWVNREMRPNGGSSMRDAVDRIETDVLALNTRMNHFESILKGNSPP